MKICIFVSVYLPNYGGIERYVDNVSKRLVSRGHEVTIVTMNTHNQKSIEEADGIKTYRLPCINTISGRYPLPRKNAEYKRVLGEVKKGDYDFILINARFYILSIIAAKFAKSRNIRCAVIEHGSGHLSVNNRLLDFMGGVYEHCQTAVLKKYCKDYYGVSKMANEWSGHFGIKSKGVFYNAVDMDELNAYVENPVCDYRKEYGIEDTAKVITFTGRILKEKGVDELYEAFEKLNDKNTYLFYAGDGPYYDKLREKVKNENVILLGRVDLAHIMALLKQSDVFCLPSVSEGMSTSVLEAIAARAFVITTKRGGAKELIDDKSLGIIIEDNESEKVYTALKQALYDEDYRASACDKAYEKLVSGFTWEVTTSEIEKVCKG